MANESNSTTQVITKWLKNYRRCIAEITLLTREVILS